MSTRSKWAARVFRLLARHCKTPLALRAKARPHAKQPERPPAASALLIAFSSIALWSLALWSLVLWSLTACAAPTTESGGSAGARAGGSSAPLQAATGLAATVERVVDGDTIIVTVDGRSETIRLLGIDTPEKAGGPRPAECFGSDASAFATQLLPVGTSVLLSRDHETRDQYSRLLAYVHRSNDGLFVNLAMLEGGYATPLFFAPNTSLQEPFQAAANTARRDWIGFWPACGAADVAIGP